MSRASLTDFERKARHLQSMGYHFGQGSLATYAERMFEQYTRTHDERERVFNASRELARARHDTTPDPFPEDVQPKVQAFCFMFAVEHELEPADMYRYARSLGRKSGRSSFYQPKVPDAVRLSFQSQLNAMGLLKNRYPNAGYPSF